MFSLKYDYFFPSLAAAKEIARKLNARGDARLLNDAELRELQRMRDELRAHREEQKLKMSMHRIGGM